MGKNKLVPQIREIANFSREAPLLAGLSRKMAPRFAIETAGALRDWLAGDAAGV